MDVKWPDHTDYTTILVRVDRDIADNNDALAMFFHTKSNLSLEASETWHFRHSEEGFSCRRLTETGFTFTGEFAPTCYMIAIACLNTKGCNVSEAKKNNLTKFSISAEISHYNVDAKEYITPIRSGSDKSGKLSGRQGLRKSPVPHLRRAHERVSRDKRIWVKDTLVNVKKEGDFTFVEKRLAYVVK